MNDSRRRRQRKTSVADTGPTLDPEVLNTLPIASWEWPRIVAFVPQYAALPHADDVFYSFWALAQQGLPIMRIPYGRVDLARNRAAQTLLGSDFTHVLMLDADHQHPPHITQRLARWVIDDPSRWVVGGLNFRRGEPYDPCAYVMGSDGLLYPPAEWGQGLTEVDAIGTGSLLIAREAFEAMDPPWFFNDYSRAWEDKWPGEDLGFCTKCRDLGIKMYVDTTTSSPHMIDGIVDESVYREYLADNPHKVISPDELPKQEV